jgi:hypothetical protein
MGSGSFSLEVAGPRMAPGRTDGVPDPDWALRVIKYLEEQQIEKLISEATPHQLLKAGNVGGELLNWIAMLGAIGHRKPNYVAPQMHLDRPGYSRPLVPSKAGTQRIDGDVVTASMV